MDYREAIEQVSGCIPLEYIAQEAGVSEETIRRTHLDPSSDFYLPPPPNWRQILARLAWERAATLQTFATEIEREAERAVL